MSKGGNWLRAYGIKDISPFGERVADLLARFVDGLHHLDRPERIKWSCDHYIEVLWYGVLSSYDFSTLTRLVLLAHDHAVRVEIRPCNMRYVRLCFTPREREGNISTRHPTVEEVLAQWREPHPALVGTTAVPSEEARNDVRPGATANPLLVPISTRMTQGQRPDDFCHVPDGVPVMPVQVCTRDVTIGRPCECARSLMATEEPFASTTTALLATWRDGGLEGLAVMYRDALVDMGWYTPGDEKALERGRYLAQHVLAGTAHLEAGDIVEYRDGAFSRRECCE